MQALKFSLLLIASMATFPGIAADKPLTGVFQGEGRACYGKLYVRAKTIEWTSSFSKCGPSRYEPFDQDMTGEHPHIAFKIDKAQKQCRHAVIALFHYEGKVWDVKGYPSLEAYQNREHPDWKNSTDPTRAVTSCGMLKQ